MNTSTQQSIPSEIYIGCLETNWYEPELTPVNETEVQKTILQEEKLLEYCGLETFDLSL